MIVVGRARVGHDGRVPSGIMGRTDVEGGGIVHCFHESDAERKRVGDRCLAVVMGAWGI